MVQLTINELQIDGEYKGNCLFAGLAIYQGHREDLLFCANNSLWDKDIINITGSQQRIISEGNSMTIVLYSVRNFTLVSASSSFTSSECTGIIINPCEYHAYCYHVFVDDFMACERYLQHLSTNQIQFHREILKVLLRETLHTFHYYDPRDTITFKMKSHVFIFTFLLLLHQGTEKFF